MIPRTIALCLTLVIAAAVTANARNLTGLSLVEFHNHTNYSVRIFIDGEDAGTLLPQGHVTLPVASGITTLHARADFINAPSITWTSTYYLQPGRTLPWILVYSR